MWIEKGAANLAKQTRSALTGLGCVGYSDAVVPIAASAAAVAVATIAVRRFWRPREQVSMLVRIFHNCENDVFSAGNTSTDCWF